MNGEPIRYIRPVMPAPEEWTPYLRESYASGYYANFGPAVRAFEQRLKGKYARDRAVITSPSATVALVTALQALGVRGKVLTPAYTFPATAHAILMAGCTPVFCDIAADSWELAPAAVAAALKDPDVRAIMHVRAYGFAHDLSWLVQLAHARGLPLIVDAAAAIGGPVSASGHVGQQGDMEVFSFHATKVFGIGEGAALFVRPELEDAVRRASNFGIQYPDDVVLAGQNSKMSDFQAAVGLAVLDKIDGFVACRQRVVDYYRQALIKHRRIAQAPAADLSPWQSYPIRLNQGLGSREVVERAKAEGLELKGGYQKPLHRTKYFAASGGASLPETEALSEHVVCLPVYSDMSLELADEVLRRLLKVLV